MNPQVKQRIALGADLGVSRWMIKTADKLHDFLMNPKSRPDLQTPESQDFLKYLDAIHKPKTDQLMPWLVREWKKGRIRFDDRWRRDEEHKKLGQTHRLTAEGDPDPNNWNRPRYYGQGGMVEHNLPHWADFMNSNHPLKREMGDIMQHRIGPFIERVHDWDDDMKAKSLDKELKGGEPVHEWPDGWSVRRLNTPEELNAEGEVMGHCVGGYHRMVQNGTTSIYSLRDPNGRPHVTTEIEPTEVDAKDGKPIPHKGNVIQIQGKANRDPEPEYKQRMKEWFETFPEHERPQWGDVADIINDPEEISPFHHKVGPYGEPDEYGLLQPPVRVDYDGMLNQIENHGSYAPEIYHLARDRKEIPQLADHFQNYQREEQDKLNDLVDQNHEWMYENFGPHPEMIEDEDEADRWGYNAPWHEMDPEDRRRAENMYENRQGDAERTLINDAADSKYHAIEEMGGLLHPHYNPETQEYQNEKYVTQPPTTFSSWGLHA